MSAVRVGSTNNGATAIIADLGGGLGSEMEITLLVDYAPEAPPGFPTRPCFTGSSRPGLPQLIKAGTRITVHEPEAKALIAAGAAMVDYSIATLGSDGVHGAIRLSDIVAIAGDQLVDEISAGHLPELVRALAKHLQIEPTMVEN